jgi:redox-sensitive bicupin YhaK (pirin superfamily)
MGKVIHRSDSRGTAEHGWLNSRHTFSFANYHNPNRMGFGILRALSVLPEQWSLLLKPKSQQHTSTQGYHQGI